MHMRNGVAVLMAGILIFSSAGSLFAGDPSPGLSDDQTRAIIELLEDKGIITGDEAAAFMERVSGQPAKEVAETTPPAETPDAGGAAIPVAADTRPEPATRADVKALREDTRRTSDATINDQRLLVRRIDDMQANTLDPLMDKAIKSEWAQRITLSGDVRLRYQGDYFAEGNDILLNNDSISDPDNPGDDDVKYNNTDRHRFRYRARLGMKAKLLDFRETNIGKVEAGFRMTTGNEEEPVSTNETMGDYMNRDSFVFDRAYLKWKWHPIDPVWDRMPQVSLVGGRFANPWFSSDLVWDSDLNFEGAAVGYETDTEQMQPFNLFFTAGIFPLQEEELQSRDKWFWGGQVGFEYRPSYDMLFTLSTAYYDYQNIEGIQNDIDRPNYYDFTAPIFMQMGNTLMDIDPTGSLKSALATDYDILDIYFNANLGIFYPVQMILEAQYVKNLGFDRDHVAEVTGNDNPVEDTDGYMVGATIGYPVITNHGEWNVGLKYKYLGADAVLDAFTDSDFHLGGTNAKGWILKGEYGLYRNVWLTTRWLSSDEIEGPQFGVDTLQVDVNARF
ncbi:putative porin [Desulfosarcina alkanivorans]|nr:putative porin [Desulfosarcina alkanivorans]